MTRRKPCPGTQVAEGACTKCFRDVRTKLDGQSYAHLARPPADRTDPRHSKYVLATYGITGVQYDQLLAFQDGKCAICLGTPRQKRLAVDHDHVTGAVRGGLCRRCNNRLLGSAHDDVEILQRAIDYLNDPPFPRMLRGTIG